MSDNNDEIGKARAANAAEMRDWFAQQDKEREAESQRMNADPKYIINRPAKNDREINSKFKIIVHNNAPELSTRNKFQTIMSNQNLSPMFNESFRERMDRDFPSEEK